MDYTFRVAYIKESDVSVHPIASNSPPKGRFFLRPILNRCTGFQLSTYEKVENGGALLMGF
jgi:hypothetical protein